MVQNQDLGFYLCPRCLTHAEAPGSCQECGTERIHCAPGDPEDPSRRPLIDAEGKVRTRAPLWWLRYTVTRLTNLIDQD